MIAFGLEGSAAVWTGRARVEKSVNLLLQHASLDGVQELFGLPECQAQMLDALGVLLQGDEVGDGFFLAIIITNNKLQFDAHGECSSGFEWWGNDAGHSTGVRRLSPASPCSPWPSLDALALTESVGHPVDAYLCWVMSSQYS